MEGEHAGLGRLGGLFIHDIDGLNAIDEVAQVVAIGDDDVFVPFLVLDFGLDFVRFADLAGDFDLGFAVHFLDGGFCPRCARMPRPRSS